MDIFTLKQEQYLLHQPHTFLWHGITATNHSCWGEVKAKTQALAKAALYEKGIRVTSIRQRYLPHLYQLCHRIKPQEISLLLQQLNTLLSTNIPLLQALTILQHNSSKPTLAILLENIRQAILAGKSLATCLAEYPQYFDKITYHLIHIGEQTGTLDKLLQQLCLQQEKQHLLNRKIKKALFYPSVVFAIAIGVSLVILIVIVPQFEALFSQFQQNLPIITRGCFTVSHHLTALVMSLFLSISLGVWRLRCKTRDTYHPLLLALPYLGSILQKLMLARFLYSLAITLAAGIPLIDALKLCGYTTQNPSYIDTINKMTRAVNNGQTFSAAIKNYALFPPLLSQFIKVGEETGTIDRMLTKIARYYETEADDLLNQFATLLEPLIMIILGVLIGTVIVAMYLPIFKLGNLI